MDQKLDEIYKELRQEEKKRIVIFGKRGVGKTWMAKKLSDRAVRKKDFDFSIWVFLCRVHDTKSLLETVARQISLLGQSDEWEAADDNKDTEKEDENEEQYKKQLKDLIHDTLAEKRVLLVLDDEGSKMKEDDIMHILESVIPPPLVAKTIVTTRRNISSTETSFEVKALADKQLSCFLQERLDISVPAIKTLAEGFLKKCKSLAITDIIVIEKALNYFGKRDSGVKLLENAFADYDEKFNVTQLLCSGYDLLPSSVLFDFLWEGEHFFRDSRSVHYSELITYWILEGYIGLISSTQKAFEMGHRVVMELIDCHVLKELEAGYVIVNVGEHVSKLRDQRELGFHGTVTIGLATVFDIDALGFGRITHKDGIVRTLFKDKEGKNLSTLLLDGNHFGVEVLDNFLKFKKVQVLAVFYPTLTSLPNSVFDLTELNVLVLRCCDFLEKVDCAPHFNHLTVLEISGATSLTKLPDDFFLHMPKLRSLNLSELKIESLPSSLFELAELRWLILRGCSCLKKVEGYLKKLENLVHLDLSSASSFENFSDKNFHSNKKLQIINLSKTKIRTLPLLKELGNLTYLLLRDCADLDRLRSIAPLTSLHTLDISGARKFKEFHDLSLEKVGKLKIINLSNTSVELLPSHVSSPRHIFLRCCPKLKQLECMDSLNHLEILDLSGSTQLCSIEEGFFDSSHCLQELMLSETKLTSLPSLSNLSNLRVLSLSCCKSLQKLPELNALTNLEELDATSCTALTVIPDKSFERMSNLQILILSGSNISSLPTLPNPNNLRKLLLKNCANLKFVSNDIILPKLEELNLSGAELSGESKANFLKSMLNLRILDLSETNVVDLPSISNLKSLRFLSLRDCKHLKVVPDLVTLTNLETLDLFGTAVSGLESLSSFKNLRQFHSSTEDFLDLKLNDLLGDSTIAQLPHGISNLPHLELLELSQKQNQGADTNKAENTGGDLNRQQWMISNWPAEVEADYNKYGIFVSSNQLSELLKDPSLWDTSFKKFHFLVRPLNQLNEKENYKYLYKKELIFRAICLQAWRFVQPAEQLRSLEICGFHNDPVGIDDLLHHAAVLYITDNPFIKVLSDLGAENIKAMKVCWIERCNKLKSVMDAEKLNGTAKPEESMEILKGNLEFMFVSNATNVEHIVRGNLPGIFKTLKCLYLDCCPKISTVFCLSQQLDNLEVLEIKFCDELTTLFEDESVQLPKLQKLHLRALPKLKKVGCVAPSLLSLQVVECPILVTILPPSPLLKILHIKCCDNLSSVFENKQSESTLPELCELHMWGLPVMKSIGVKVPSLKDCIIRECPKLEEDSSLTNCEGGFRESSTNR